MASSESVHNLTRVLQHDAQASWHKQIWVSVTLEGVSGGLISPEDIESSGTACRKTFKKQYNDVFQAYDTYGPHKGSYITKLQPKNGSFEIHWVSLNSLLKRKRSDSSAGETLSPEERKKSSDLQSTDQQHESSDPLNEQEDSFSDSEEIDEDEGEPATELLSIDSVSESSASQSSGATSTQDSQPEETEVSQVFTAEDHVNVSQPEKGDASTRPIHSMRSMGDSLGKMYDSLEKIDKGFNEALDSFGAVRNKREAVGGFAEEFNVDSTKTVTTNDSSLEQDITRVKEELERRELLKSMEDIERFTGDKIETQKTPAHLVDLSSAVSQLEQARSRLKQRVTPIVREKLQGVDIFLSPERNWIQSITNSIKIAELGPKPARGTDGQLEYHFYQRAVFYLDSAYKLYLQAASKSTSHDHVISPEIAKARPAAASLALKKQGGLDLPSGPHEHASTRINPANQPQIQPKSSTKAVTISTQTLQGMIDTVQEELDRRELLRVQGELRNLKGSDNDANPKTDPKHLIDIPKALSGVEEQLALIKKATLEIRLGLLEGHLTSSPTAESLTGYAERYIGYTESGLNHARFYLARSERGLKADAYKEYKNLVDSFTKACGYYSRVMGEVNPDAKSNKRSNPERETQ